MAITTCVLAGRVPTSSVNVSVNVSCGASVPAAWRMQRWGVEYDNPRARVLYERLGYVAYADAPEEWDAEGPGGEIFDTARCAR